MDQDPDTHFVRACAVETRLQIAKEPPHTEIYRLLCSSIASLIHSWIHQLIDSLIYSVSGAWILSCPFIGISTTICSFVGAPHNFNVLLFLHLKMFPVGHLLPIVIHFFRNFRPRKGRALLVYNAWAICTLIMLFIWHKVRP
jgi:hypothetical protein